MESNIHWRYFLSIDEDFGILSRYIEPDHENFDAYSLEMVRLLMAATQECDVVLKELCKSTGNSACNNEQDYRSHLTKELPQISSVKIVCPRYQLDFTPFSGWQRNRTPEWWTANNKVKHQRLVHYTEASLENVMNSIAGLLVSNIYLLRDSDDKIWLSPAPIYFKPDLRIRSARTVMNSQYEVPV